MVKKTKLAQGLEIKTEKSADTFLEEINRMRHYVNFIKPSPFTFNQTVTGRQYLNRKVELQEIMTKLKGPALVFVCGYKGFGKTSFGLRLSKELTKRNREYSIAYVDMLGDLREMHMFSRYGTTLSGKDDRFDKKIDKAKSVEVENYLKEIRASLKRDGKQKALLIIDDFDGRSTQRFDRQIVKLFEIVWKNRKWLSVCVFFRNVPVTLRLIFNTMRANRPKLYELGSMLYLNEFKANHWYDYFSPRFKKKNQIIEKSVVNYMMTKMNNIPWAMQRLAHQLYTTTNSKITRRKIDIAIQTVVEMDKPTYEKTFSHLNKLEQAALLGKNNNIPINRSTKTWGTMEFFFTAWSLYPFFLDPFFEHFIKTEKLGR